MNKKKIIIGVVAIIIAAALVFAGYKVSEYVRIQNAPAVGTPIAPPKSQHKPMPTPTDSQQENISSDTASQDKSSSIFVDEKEKQELDMYDGDPTIERVLKGRIVDVSSSMIFFKDEATGKELYFDYVGAETVGELIADVSAEIFYTGLIEDGDASNIDVNKIVTFPG